MEKKFELGHKIKNLRIKAGLTQEQLAEKVDMDSKHLSKIENGLHLPTYKTLRKLAEILDFSFDNENDDLQTKQKSAYIKSLKILNSAKDDKELDYFLEVLKLAKKGLNLKY